MSGTRGAAWSPPFSDGQAGPCSGFCDGPHWCRGARGAPLSPHFPGGASRSPSRPCGARARRPGHRPLATGAASPAVTCRARRVSPHLLAPWALRCGARASHRHPRGERRGERAPPPSLLDGPSTMLRPRQGDSPLRAACICPLCEAVGAAELTPRCRVLQFFYSASPASPQPPGT